MSIVKQLLLEKLDTSQIFGIYGESKTKFASRMSFLHPSAKKAYLEANKDIGPLILSDMYRSPKSSLQRRLQRKYGVAKPGYSAHNYGLAIDVAVDRTLGSVGVDCKLALDLYLLRYGWVCHRQDHKLGSESWHYNYLPSRVAAAYKVDTHSSAGWIEDSIRNMYSEHWWILRSVHMYQGYLKHLGMYKGHVDGKDGPKTVSGVKVFQKSWGLSVDGKVGPQTSRVLWCVAQDSLATK